VIEGETRRSRLSVHKLLWRYTCRYPGRVAAFIGLSIIGKSGPFGSGSCPGIVSAILQYLLGPL